MTDDLVISPSAEAELDDHAEFIAWESPAAAKRFLGAAKETFQSVLRMPRAGRRWLSNRPHLRDVRVWPVRGFRNYLIFYRPLDDGIEVLHVFHGARDIPALLEADEA